MILLPQNRKLNMGNKLFWLKDSFSCGPINMKFEPHEICSNSIARATDRTDCTVKITWAELRKSLKCRTRRQNCGCCPIIDNDSVKMTSWDWQEGACIPKFSLNSMQTISHVFIQKTFVSPFIDAEIASAPVYGIL